MAKLNKEQVAAVLERLDQSTFVVEGGNLIVIDSDGIRRSAFIPMDYAASNRGLPPAWFAFPNPQTGATDEIENPELNTRLAEEWKQAIKRLLDEKAKAAEAEQNRPITKEELLALFANTQAHLIRAVVGCVADVTKSYPADPNEVDPQRLNGPVWRLAGLVFLGYGSQYGTKVTDKQDKAWAQKCLDFIIQRTISRRFNALELGRGIRTGRLFDEKSIRF